MVINEENLQALMPDASGKILSKKWLMRGNLERVAYNVDAILITVDSGLCAHVIKKVVFDNDMNVCDSTVENFWDTFSIEEIDLPLLIDNSLPRVKEEYVRLNANEKVLLEKIKGDLKSIATSYFEGKIRNEIKTMIREDVQLTNFCRQIATIVEDKNLKKAYSIARTAMKTGMLSIYDGNTISWLKLDSVTGFKQEGNTGNKVTTLTVSDGNRYVIKEKEFPELFLALNIVLGPLAFNDFLCNSDMLI